MPTKVRLVKAIVFPVIMYGCASWTILYAMQKDMIDLTDAIDLMAKYYVATKYQAPVNKQKYDDTVHNAKALAEEVFTRWENSTIEEIK